MIKLNQINNIKKLKILQGIEIINCHISEKPKFNSMTFNEFKDFRVTVPSKIKISCSFEEWSDLDEDYINSLLSSLNIDYFQCPAPEYFKCDELENFLQKINKVKHKIIISTSFSSEENIGEELKGLSSLFTDNIAYFEIYLESMIDRDSYNFNKNQIDEIESFCKKYPTLLSDNFDTKESLVNYKITNNKGFFLTLKSTKNEYMVVNNYGIRELYKLLK